MKNIIINFYKKYPITILLGIIAMNLFSIEGSLKYNEKLAYFVGVCTRYFALYSDWSYEQAESNEIITAIKSQSPNKTWYAYWKKFLISNKVLRYKIGNIILLLQDFLGTQQTTALHQKTKSALI